MQRYWLIYVEAGEQAKIPIHDFVNQGIWETDNETHKETLQQIQKNDLLFINEKGDAKKIEQIRKGKVLRNSNDGRTLNVEWDTNIYNAFIEVTSSYKLGLIEILQHEILTFIKACFPNIKHALATTGDDKKLENEGYKVQGIIGYIHKSTNEEQTESDLVPLYQDYEKERDDYFCYTNEKINTERQNANIFPSLLGYLSLPGKEDELFLEFRNFISMGAYQDNFYCTQPNEKILEGLFYKGVDEFGYLWGKPSISRTTVYVYSKTPDMILFEPLPEKTTDANIISDNPAKVDELGRDALMEILFKKINKIWHTWDTEENYTILINGEWGSGKSSMLNYLKNYLKKGKWQIIEYNAWEQQHVNNQWWVLINKISKQLTSNSYDYTTSSHNFWKFRLKNRNSILLLFLVIIFLASTFILTNVLISGADDDRTQELIVSIIGVVATISVTIIGIVQNIFTRNINTPQLVSNYTTDPYKPIKDRFKEVTRNKKVAILIDDLDRCEVKPTVELLEGIQNLFKSTKILYVIAADGNWVSNCFNKKYEDFDSLKKEGHSIGNQFLQKAFQLIVDVPKISDMERKNLWKKFLGVIDKENEQNIENGQQDTSISIGDDTEEHGQSNPETKKFENEKKEAEEAEKFDDHFLLDYLDITPKNPREIKRLINQFIIKKQSLIISKTKEHITDDVLLRYIIFASKYPDYDKKIKQKRITLKKLIEIEIEKEQKKENDKKKKEKEIGEIQKIVGDELNDDLIRQYL